MKKLLPVSLFVLVILGLFVIKVLSSHNWDPKSFILLRPENIPIEQDWGVGYDGQISYVLAVDPWNPPFIKKLSAYRYQRILYPMLIRVISLGHEAAIPWVMLGVNLVSTLISVIIFGTLIQRRNHSAWLVIVFTFSLGYLLTIRLDLLEPLTFTFALGGLLAYEEENIILAIVLFSLSGLTKEVGLLFPVAIVTWELLRRNWRRFFFLIICFLPYVIWFGFLYVWLGTSQEQLEQSRMMLIPLAGLRYVKDTTSLVLVGTWVLLPAGISIAFTLWQLIRDPSNRRNIDSLLLLCNSLFVLVIPQMSWEDPIAVLRLGLGALLSLLLWCSSFFPRFLPFIAALYLPSGIVVFLIPGMI